MGNPQGYTALDELHLQENGVALCGLGKVMCWKGDVLAQPRGGGGSSLLLLSAVTWLQKSDGALEDESSFN